jgi:hypothetical protein
LPTNLCLPKLLRQLPLQSRLGIAHLPVQKRCNRNAD